MSQEQTKNLLINIVTVLVIVGILVEGYFVFKGKQVVGPGETAVAPSAENATEIVVIGSEIARTVTDLQDLKRSVEGSATVFSMPEFKNLQDFSTSIPSEVVGRTNPFITTDWKLKTMALEEAVKGGASATSATSQPQSTPVSSGI